MSMDKFELQKLRDLPIEGVAERLGLEIRQHKALCPFHNDHHPSLSFNVRRNTYRCFVCDAHGGTIDLVMHLLHKDFREACAWLSNGSIEALSSPFSSPERGPGGEAVFDASRYARFFERPWLSQAVRRFLFDERRLDPRVVRWCRLTSWRDRQGTDWLQIPYYDRDGRLIGIQNRNLSNLNHNDLPGFAGDMACGSSESRAKSKLACFSEMQLRRCNHQRGANVNGQPRFRFPRGSQCGIYNLPILNRLQPGEPLYITEGASDCWAMLSAGHKAIAIPSATLLKPNDLNPLYTLHSTLYTPFHMYPDRDAPGERLFLQLKELLPNLQHHQLPMGCKDYGDYYVKVKNEK